MRTHRHGMSRIDALVILLLVGLGLGLLFQATREVSEKHLRLKCVSYEKGLILAHLGFQAPDLQAQVTSNPFPTGCTGPGVTPPDRLSWVVTILPYFENSEVHKQFNLDAGYLGNLTSADKPIKQLKCPSTYSRGDSSNITNYVTVAGLGLDAASQPTGTPGNGFMGYDRTTSVESIKDGLSNTIAILETQSEPGPWARGGTSTLRGVDLEGWPVIGDQRQFGLHDGGVNVGMADGSIRFVRASVDRKLFAATITIAGGELGTLE